MNIGAPVTIKDTGSDAIIREVIPYEKATKAQRFLYALQPEEKLYQVEICGVLMLFREEALER